LERRKAERGHRAGDKDEQDRRETHGGDIVRFGGAGKQFARVRPVAIR
jgi:hypothetical protein